MAIESINSYKKRKKDNKLTDEEKTSKGVESLSAFAKRNGIKLDNKGGVKNTSGLFQKSDAFKDGYQFGDVTKTVGASLGDFASDVGEGFFRTAEGVADWGQYKVSDALDFFGADNAAKKVRNNAKFNSTGAIFGKNEDENDNLFGKGWTDSLEDNSVLGDTADTINQGIGNVAAMAGMVYMGGSALGANGAAAAGATAKANKLRTIASAFTSYTSAYGNARSTAYENGADDYTAHKYGIISGISEAVSEQFFDAIPGMKVEGWGSNLTGKVAGKLEKSFGTKIGKTFLHITNAAGEGAEEIISNFLQATGTEIAHYTGALSSKITGNDKLKYNYERESNNPFKNIGDKVFSADSAMSFFSAAMTSALIGGGNNFLNNQQKNTILKEYAKENNMSVKDAKTMLEKTVMAQTNVEAGNENFSDKMETMDNIQRQELQNMKRNIFVEQGQKDQAFQYKETDNKQVNNMLKSLSEKGNNTVENHATAQMAEKLIRDFGYDVEFTNNAELKESGRAENAAGFKEGNKIYLNLDSNELASYVMGHETTHFLEKTDLYDDVSKAVYELATTKGVHEGNLKSIEKTYEKYINEKIKKEQETLGRELSLEEKNQIKEDVIKSELTANYVGSFFTDEDFFRTLGKGNPGKLQQFAEFLKELYYKVTGQQEKAQILKAQQLIRKVYAEYTNGGQINDSTSIESEIKNEAISEQNNKEGTNTPDIQETKLEQAETSSEKVNLPVIEEVEAKTNNRVAEYLKLKKEYDNTTDVNKKAELETKLMEMEDTLTKKELKEISKSSELELNSRNLPLAEESRAATLDEVENNRIEASKSLNDKDAPVETTEEYDGDNSTNEVADPLYEDGRTWSNVGNRSVKAYQYEHPEVKSFFQEEAGNLLWELDESSKGERIAITNPNTGEMSTLGIKRSTSKDIANLLDNYELTYAEIEKGLRAIIDDNGAENIAVAKRLEFVINERLMNGYDRFGTQREFGNRAEPNQEYLKLLEENEWNNYRESTGTPDDTNLPTVDNVDDTQYLLANTDNAKLDEKQKQRLEYASYLKKQDATDEEIWNKTGVILGDDITKSKIYVKDLVFKDDVKDKLRMEKPLKLSEVLEGKIFENYPELKDYYIEIADFEKASIEENYTDEEIKLYSKVKAAATNDKGILLNSLKIESLEDAENTLAHEVQHLIQNIKSGYVENTFGILQNEGVKNYKLHPKELEAEVNRVLNSMTTYQRRNINPKSIEEEIKKYYKENNYGHVDVNKVINRLVNKHGIQYMLSEDNKGHEIPKGLQERMKDSKARDEEGRLKQLYHGTATGEFYTFDKSMANPEEDWGAGFYLTDNESDVGKNYEDGGPDFENRIARLAEQISSEQDVEYDEAEEMAREELYKGSYKISAYVDMKNPAYVGKTYIFNQDDYYENYNMEDYESEDDYYADVEQLVADDIDSAIWAIQREYDIDYYEDDIRNKMWDAYYNGGMEIEEFKNSLQDIEIDDGEGRLANHDVARIILESLGYDGIIIEKPVYGETQKYYVAFNSDQFKNVDNTNPTNSDDMRFLLSDDGNYQLYNPKKQFNNKLSDGLIEKPEENLPTAKRPNLEPKKEGKTYQTALPGFKDVEIGTPTRHEIITKFRDLAKDKLGDITKIKDKKKGIMYQVNTMKRNLRDIMTPEQAKDMYDTYFKPITENNAAAEKDITSYNERIQKYNLTNEESTYTQLVGELKYNPESELTSKRVEEYYEKNSNKIDKEKVNKAVEEFRNIYDELIGRINDTLVENGYKPIEYRKGYFPHFIEEKATSPLGKLAEKLGWKVKSGTLPTDIAGITDQFKPGKVWTSFSQQRTSDATDYNALKGLDNYLRGAMDTIHHTEDIQKLRALENEIRYQYSSKGIQEKIDNIYMDEDLDMNEKDEAIYTLTSGIRNSSLGNFATEIRNYTDNLANKKAFGDRSMEQAFGRDTYSIMQNINSRVSANMVGANISSAMTNFIPITQAWSQVSTKNLMKGIYESVKTSIKDDGFANNSVYLTNRTKQADRLYKTGLDKVNDKLGVPFEAIDEFTSNTIVRAKYYDNIEKGMSEKEAMSNADEFAKDVMAGRSKGDMPTIFNQKNPVAKLFTAFQLEVNNQYGYMFKDIPADLGGEAKDKLAKAFIKMFLGAFLYNHLSELITGRKSAFSPIDMAIDDIKTATNDNMDIGDKISSIAKETAKELPFVGGIMGGGRLPLQGAIPYSNPLDMVTETISDVSKAFDGENKQTAINNLVKEWSKPLYYVAMPFAGGQLKKTVEGLSMYDDNLPVAGSYTNSGKLRFEADDSALGKLQAAVFGQYASKNAREYFENGYSPLTENQINEALETGMNINEYREYKNGLKKQESNEDKINYIYNLPLEDSQKNTLANNVLNRKEDVDISNYGDYGSLEEFDYATKNPGKYAAISQISDFNSYNSYKDEINSIKEQYTNSNDRKSAVFSYINSLSLNKYQKTMLYKLAGGYSIKNYKNDMYNYINSLDITAEEKKTIYNELFD